MSIRNENTGLPYHRHYVANVIEWIEDIMRRRPVNVLDLPANAVSFGFPSASPYTQLIPLGVTSPLFVGFVPVNAGLMILLPHPRTWGVVLSMWRFDFTQASFDLLTQLSDATDNVLIDPSNVTSINPIPLGDPVHFDALNIFRDFAYFVGFRPRTELILKSDAFPSYLVWAPDEYPFEGKHMMQYIVDLGKLARVTGSLPLYPSYLDNKEYLLTHKGQSVRNGGPLTKDDPLLWGMARESLIGQPGVIT